MEEDPEIEKNLKKYLSNTINSNINKKNFKNEAKIDELMEKTNSILQLLNNFNERIKNIEKALCINIESDSNNIILEKANTLKKVESNIELLKKLNENIDSDTDNFIEEEKNIEKKKKVKKQKTQEVLITKYIEINVKHFDIDENIIKKCLNMNNLNGDIQLFKKMYIENVAKEYIPIRHIKKKFQYWINDHMKDDDTNGEYIINVIIKNIELCYMKVNNMDNYGDDIVQFLKNQEHINQLQDIKYKEKMLISIIKLIDI